MCGDGGVDGMMGRGIEKHRKTQDGREKALVEMGFFFGGGSVGCVMPASSLMKFFE